MLCWQQKDLSSCGTPSAVSTCRHMGKQGQVDHRLLLVKQRWGEVCSLASAYRAHVSQHSQQALVTMSCVLRTKMCLHNNGGVNCSTHRLTLNCTQ
jgi:hypothetical protein